MTTFKNIIGKQLRRMKSAGIVDATAEEALGYLIWQHFLTQCWKLPRVIYWILRYADYHREAAEIERVLQAREAADCAALHFSERRQRVHRAHHESPSKNRFVSSSPDCDDNA